MVFWTELTDKINGITLNFPDEREKEYREFYFERSYKTTRFAYLILSIIYAFFGYLDSVVAGQYFGLFIIIRSIVVILLLFVFFYSFSKNFRHNWQTLIFITYFAGAVGIILMLVLLPVVVVYSSGLILVFLAGSVLIKLRFLAFSIASWLVIFLYIVAGIVWKVDYAIVLSNTFFFSGAILIGMIAAYRTEVFNRDNFNLYLQIAKKNVLIEHANRNLEDKVEQRTKLLNHSNKELREEVRRRAIVEKELIAAKERAEESDKLKSAFLANMSHEIRTPMNGILGFANLLHEAENEEEFNEFVDAIIKSGEHLLNLINDIIDLSKIEAGILKIEKSNFELNRLTREIYDIFSVETNVVTKNIDFSYRDGLPDNNCMIYTDRVRLKQIMINLVNNACKYTDRGSIEFYYKIKGSSLHFVVKDTGIGIPEESQKVIFDRFMQASNGRTTGRDSTGLGLSITNTYLNLMGGNISVKSKLDVGSEFSFTLPDIFENHKPVTNDASKLGK
ncbi:MAG: Signal transduction histidine [Prolixibacteraceae bacterium]|nr:MAG: Signal transduction histidine [Prolixibacteraceae bacterium]